MVCAPGTSATILLGAADLVGINEHVFLGLRIGLLHKTHGTFNYWYLLESTYQHWCSGCCEIEVERMMVSEQ